MPAVLRPGDADAVASFVRAARPLSASLLRLTGTDPGRVTAHWRHEVAVVAAAPGLGGRLASAAQGVVAAGAQGTLAVALCLAAGVEDEREQVRVVAVSVLERDLPEGWSPGAGPEVEVDRRGGLGAQLAALGRTLNANRRVVGGREEGRLWHRALGMLPVVGAGGALLGERHALARVAQRARRELGT